MTDSTSEEKNDNIPVSGTRARAKVPKILKAPNGEVIKLTRKMRSIVTRIPTAKDVAAIADEMNCSKGMVYHTMRIPAVQQYLKEQMESAGITHGLLMERIREGLDATKEDRAGGERADFGERREHVKLALRLQGLDTPAQEDKGDTVTNNSIYNIVIQARQARGLDGK